jgi:prohibitin 1
MIMIVEAPESATPVRQSRLRLFWNRNWMSITMGALLFVLALAFLSDRIFISIYPGQAMILYRRFQIDSIPNKVYQEGFHIVSPWDVTYKYDLHYRQMTVPIVALTKNGLAVTVEASITFRPIAALLPHLHRSYGQSYTDKLVVPQLRRTIQDIVGQFLPEEIYALARSAQHEQMFERAQRVIGGVYIDIGDVSIISIQLPSKIQQAIQEKLEEQQLVQLYDFRVQKEKKEAERKYQEALGIQRFQETIARGITPSVLQWKGIEATLDLAKSPNSKVVVIGAGNSGLPLILGNELTGK